MVKTINQIEKRLAELRNELGEAEKKLVDVIVAYDQALMKGEDLPDLQGPRDHIDGLRRLIRSLDDSELVDAHDRENRKRRQNALHHARKKHLERMKLAQSFDTALSEMWLAWKAYTKSNPEIAERAAAGGANVQSALRKVGSTKVRDDTLTRAILAVAPDALPSLGVTTNLKARHAQSLEAFEAKVGEIITAAEKDLDQTSPQVHKRKLALNDG